MHILMLSTMYLRNKTDTRGLMVSEIAHNLISKKHRVSVLAPHQKGLPKKEKLFGVAVHRFSYFLPSLQKLAYGAGIPTNLRKSFLAKLQVPFFALNFLLKTISLGKKADVINAQWIESGLIGILARPFTKKPVVVTVRRVSSKGFMRLITKFVLKNADFVVFNSNYTKKRCLSIARPKKSKVVHNSVDTKHFKPQKSSWKKKLNIKNKVILFVGLLVEKKGLKYLLEALSTIPNADLVIAGNGPLKESLQDQARNLNIEKRVYFLGTVKRDKIPSLYAAADVFVLPSIVDSKGETETLGVVLLEALSTNIPVVGSSVGGIPDVISSEAGFLVPPKKPKELSKAIKKALSSKRRKGRTYIKNKFSAKIQTAKLLEIYKNVWNSRI